MTVTCFAMQVGLTGDTAMYNVLLRLGARRGKSSTELHSRFQGMAALGVAPDQHTHVILLQACAAEANAGLALVVWQAMLDAGEGLGFRVQGPLRI